jgi:hypothetical protein
MHVILSLLMVVIFIVNDRVHCSSRFVLMMLPHDYGRLSFWSRLRVSVIQIRVKSGHLEECICS